MLPSPQPRGLGLRSSSVSRPPVGSLALRPGDSLTIPRMALSIGFLRFVSSTDAIQATGLLTIALVGLTPTEHASLCWTHVGSGTGAVARRCPQAPIPAPATSHVAGGFPALRVPAHFTSRVMGPSGLRRDVKSSPQVLQLDGCFYHGTPASHVGQDSLCSKAPSLHGNYPASSLLRA